MMMMMKGVVRALLLCCTIVFVISMEQVNNNKNVVNVRKTNVNDYLDVISAMFPIAATALGGCNCLFSSVTQGRCNSICDVSKNCTAAIGSLTACANLDANCTKSCGSTLASAGGIVCSGFGGDVLFGGESLCKATTFTISQTVRATNISSTLRSACAATTMNDASCAAACAATTCSSYISNLATCVSAGSSNSTCTSGISALKDAFDNHLITCDHYNPPLACSSATSFSTLHPNWFKFRIDNDLGTNCSCAHSSLNSTTLCDKTKLGFCDMVSNLATVAASATSCSSCATSLASLNTFLSGSYFNCTSAYSNVTCIDQVIALKANSVTPDFEAVPSFSTTGTPAPSKTPTRSVTPTQTPTKSVTPTQTPTKSDTPTKSLTPSNTPTISVTPSNTPTISVTPSNTPTISITASITPSISLTPTNTPSSSASETVGYTGSASSASTMFVVLATIISLFI